MMLVGLAHLGFPRVEDGHAKIFKIFDIARDHSKPMFERSCGDLAIQNAKRTAFELSLASHYAPPLSYCLCTGRMRSENQAETRASIDLSS